MSRPYLLDTDTIVFLLRGDSGVADAIRRAGARAITTTTINLAELYYGAFNSERAHENLKPVDTLRRRVRVLPFDRRAAVLFGKIKADLRRRGQAPSDSDLFIAAVALAGDCVLVTHNVRHFRRIHELDLEDWVSPPAPARRS